MPRPSVLVDYNASELSHLDAQMMPTEKGPVVLREKFFSSEFTHGAEIGQFAHIDTRLFGYAAKNPSPIEAHFEEFAFIDTETTGLAGGTGTYVFLIGVGFFESDRFVLRQILLPDFSAESAFLAFLFTLLDKKKVLVSFNGKSYDIPLLQSRLVMNKMPQVLSTFAHYDLLHISRRLWRKHTPCNLSSLENTVLGMYRQDDILGAAIPQVYFDFLSHRNWSSLKLILKHNAMDILSLVALSVKICDLFQGNAASIAHDVYGIVRTFEDLKLFDSAAAYLAPRISEATAHAERGELLSRLAFQMKKLRRFSEAEQLWLEAQSSGPFHPDSYIELAKIYEHKKNDPVRAFDMVQKAYDRFQLLIELGKEPHDPALGHELNRRRTRLLQKIARARRNEEKIVD